MGHVLRREDDEPVKRAGELEVDGIRVKGKCHGKKESSKGLSQRRGCSRQVVVGEFWRECHHGVTVSNPSLKGKC